MVEDEENVLIHCPKYMLERKELLTDIKIQNIDVACKHCIIRQIFEYQRQTAKFIIQILNIKKDISIYFYKLVNVCQKSSSFLLQTEPF